MSGLLGGLLLSGDLAFYRVMDGLNANRAQRAANVEIEHAWAANDDLVHRLNTVINAYNDLLHKAQAYDADCNRRFTALERRIAELERENAELRGRNDLHERTIRSLEKGANELIQENGELRSGLREARHRIAELTGENQE